MRRFVVIATAVMLANSIDLPAGPGAFVTAQDRVAELVAQVKQALGGDKLAAVKAVSAEGPFRRSMGQRDMEGTIMLTVVRPDRLRRSEEMSMGGTVGGPTVERVSAFNGTEAWDDIQNRGGMGGGMQMIIRGPGGPGGPGGRAGPGDPAAGGALTPEQIEQQRVRRMKMELQRWTVALFAESAQPFSEAGVAESPDGRADVLETKDEAGRAVRLFIDQATHLPVMLQYQEIRPRIMMAGGPGGPGGRGGAGRGQGGPGDGQRPSAEEMQRRIEEMRKQGPPPPSAFAMHLSDYKKVEGVMLPHKVDISIEGVPNEEWTIEKFKVNPPVKAEEFEKPKQ
jgi:hypothetical protein